ncbi:MAG: histidine phosphatase family protein [Dehalococcoidia bacterium]|nr:histidine phosphatase family protein [Dehalococcoidia bacterium]
MSARLLLVRHAEPQAWPGVAASRRLDPPLSERGRRQAAALAEALREHAPVAFYAGPALRVRETAAAAAAALGLAVTVDERLRSREEGALPELMGAVLSRALEALRELAARHEGRAAVVVSHTPTLGALIAHALGGRAETWARIRLDPAAITVLDIHSDQSLQAGGGFGVAVLNDRCHLEGLDGPDDVDSTVGSR